MKPVLSYSKYSGIVAVLGKNGSKLNASVEDVRFAKIEDELAVNCQEPIDVLDISLGNTINDLDNEETVTGRVD